MTQFIDTLVGIFQSSGFAQFGQPGGWLYAVMICVGCFLLYLAIVKEFEPLILLPMAFGMILANLPGSGIIHMQYFVGCVLINLPSYKVHILNSLTSYNQSGRSSTGTCKSRDLRSR